MDTAGKDVPLGMTPRKRRPREPLGAEVLSEPLVLTGVGKQRCELLEFRLIALLPALFPSSPCSVSGCWSLPVEGDLDF